VGRVTAAEVLTELRDHKRECARMNAQTVKATKAVAASNNKIADSVAGMAATVGTVQRWLDGWTKFKRWIVSAAAAILLTIVAGTVGSFWNGVQSNAAAEKAARAVQVAAPTPAEQATRDAREKQIDSELAAIKSKIGN
jgi:hypothetical protein